MTASKVAPTGGEARAEGSGPVVLLYGTRPQTIKASVIRRAFSDLPLLTVDTGQHYDYELNQLLYEQLGVAPPDQFLEVGSGSHAEQTASVMIRCEALLVRAAARVAIVVGDTNSTLGAALAAAKLRIPVVHVEAGLRSADGMMAEEINRRAVDAIAAVLCAPSRASFHRLRAESPSGRILETGDVAYDVLLGQVGQLPPVRDVLPDGVSEPYVYATLHRAELTEQPELLAEILTTLAGTTTPVILPLHPRTRAALWEAGLPVESRGSLHVLAPVGYLQSLSLTRHAAAVVTDSGGLQREAYWLGTPCLTVRTETEWTETVDCGANALVPPLSAPRELLGRLEDLMRTSPAWDRKHYGDGGAAVRVAAAVRDLLSA